MEDMWTREVSDEEDLTGEVDSMAESMADTFASLLQDAGVTV